MSALRRALGTRRISAAHEGCSEQPMARAVVGCKLDRVPQFNLCCSMVVIGEVPFCSKDQASGVSLEAATVSCMRSP